MPVLHIYKLDSGEDVVTKLQDGEHVIGRGPLLQCEDRRVSRNHGIIKVMKNGITITPTHINPCFYQPKSSKTISILTKDIPTPLNDGDKFALLPDKYWYKIKLSDISNETYFDNLNQGDNLNATNTKRGFEEDTHQSPSSSKKLKTNTDGEVEENCSFLLGKEVGGSTPNKVTPANILSVLENLKRDTDIFATALTTIKSQTDGKVELDTECDESPKARNQSPQNKKIQKVVSLSEAQLKELLFSSDEDEAIESKAEVDVASRSDSEIASKRTSNDSTTSINQKDDIPTVVIADSSTDVDAKPDKIVAVSDDQKAGPSDTNKKRQWRDRCWYGMNCYRKSTTHLGEFSHPGDSDYDSDPKDDRPACSFGAGCYRRNKDHRREYKHPKDRPNPSRKRKKDNAQPKKRRVPKPQYKDTPEDDYDLNDPFIDDSGSEYELSAESSEDSDSSYSSHSDEGTKRLLKEAEHFTKG